LSKLISIIPARSGSKGLLNKNILDFNGIPLINWSIKFALKSKLIDRCIVSTDSTKIANIAKKAGAEVPFIRDDILATDEASSSSVILDVVRRCKLKDEDIILLLEPTSPFRTFEDLKKGLDLIRTKSCKKLVSVSEAVSSSYRFQFERSDDSSAKLIKLKFNQFPNNLRRQEIIKSYYLDGSFYFSYVKAFKDENGFLGESTGTIESNYFSSFEIDNYNDFRLLESIFVSVGLPF